MRMKRRKGITKLEVIVVFLAIAILAALMMPALARAKSAAPREKCEGNLRAIAMGLASYAYKNSDLMPQSASFNHTNWSFNQGRSLLLLSWNEALVIDGDINQATNRDGKLDRSGGSWQYPACGYGVFLCPAHTATDLNGRPLGNRTYHGYGMAWCATSDFGYKTGGGPASAKRSVKASRLVPDHITVADGWNTMGTSAAYSNPAHSMLPGPYGVYEPHFNDNVPGANYLFADGHVEWSATFGFVPSPPYFGADASKAVPPVWVHPRGE
jgi:prepilin-type processing-associated H-X9-DG protein